MEDLQITYSIGAVLFGLASLITGGVFGFFVYTGRVSVNSAKDHVHWLSSIWIYMLLSTTFLLLAMLYALNATGYGFWVKANLHVINLFRWLTIAAVGTLYQICLAYILTNDHRTFKGQSTKKKKTAIGAQNFFILFYYALSQFSIFFATITENRNGHIICMVGSMITFIISVVLYFFPHDKIRFEENTAKDQLFYNKEVREIEEKLTMAYRISFLVLLCLSYAINFIVWFLCRSNDFNDSISLEGEAIAYLVSDILFFVLFGALLVGLTLYYRVKTRALVSKNTVEGNTVTTVNYQGAVSYDTSYLHTKNM